MIRKTVKTLWKLFQVWRLECSLYTHHRAGVLSEIYLFIFTFISWSFTEIAEWIFVTGALSGWSRKWGSFRKIIKVEKKCGKLRVGGFKKGQFSTLFQRYVGFFPSLFPTLWATHSKVGLGTFLKGKYVYFFSKVILRPEAQKY